MQGLPYANLVLAEERKHATGVGRQRAAGFPTRGWSPLSTSGLFIHGVQRAGALWLGKRVIDAGESRRLRKQCRHGWQLWIRTRRHLR
jgi:hypothetical protein